MTKQINTSAIDHLQVAESLPTKSAKIRYLFQNGYEKGKIAKILNIRYQHVRNVLITPVTNPKK